MRAGNESTNVKCDKYGAGTKRNKQLFYGPECFTSILFDIGFFVCTKCRKMNIIEIKS